MDFSLSSEQQLIVDTARKIAESYGEEYFREKRLAQERPIEFLSDLSEAGFFGIPLPESHGGEGLGMLEVSLIMETLGKAGAWEHLNKFTRNTVFGGITLSRYGTDDQKSEYMEQICRGEMSFSLGVTEPEAGSNMLRTATFAERDGDEFVISGSKVFNSGLDDADQYVLLTRTKKFSDVERRSEGFTVFLIDPDASGIEYEPVDIDIFWPAGHRTFTVHIDQLRVHKSQVLGEVHEGFEPIFDVLNPERISTASEHLGRGRWVLSQAVDYANEREVWGDPIGAHQSVQHPLAESYADLESASTMVRQAASAFDNDSNDTGKIANIGHLKAGRAAFQAADNALETFGGSSAVAEFGIAAVWSLSRHQRIAPITENMKLNYIANNVLDLPRSYGV